MEFIKVLLSVAAVCAVPMSASAGEPSLPIFDTHLHYSRDAWQGLPPQTLIAVLKRNNVTRALVSSTPDDGARTLAAAEPARFVVELRPYAGTINPANWANHPETPGYLKSRLASGAYRGLGEFHLFEGKSFDTPVFRQALDLALDNRLILHVHSMAEAINRLFTMAPNVRVLWAHAGMSEPPAVIRRLLKRYPNLWTELSFRAEDIFTEGGVAPAWRALFEAFPGRFMIGTDTYVNERWAAYDDLIADHRQWLERLPDGLARRIAHGNAEKLFGGNALTPSD